LSEKFDSILVFYMLHEVPVPLTFFRGIKALLKADGKVLIVEPKWHVSRGEFLESINIMKQAGFVVLAEPKIRFSRTVVLGNNGDGR
jgi:SAM-dependent methyltransferase